MSPRILAALLLLLGGCTPTVANWSKNVRCHPRQLVRPLTLQALQAVVRRADRVRVIGAGHSFNELACGDGVMLDLRALHRVLSVDRAQRLVRVEAGISLHDLDEALAAEGLALATEPTIDKVTLGGALATGSHGTGYDHGVLGEELTAMEVVDAQGSLRRLDGAELRAAKVGLGALGVVYAVTLKVEPAFRFEIEEQVLDADPVLSRLAELPLEHEHADLFWFPTEKKVFLRTYRRTEAPIHLEHPARDWVLEQVVRTWVAHFGLALASKIPGVTPLLNRVEPVTMRPRLEVDRSDHILHRFPGHQRVVSMEYAIPVERAGDAVRALSESVRATGFYPNMPVYIRFSGGAGDALLSQLRGRRSCVIEVLSYPGFAGWEPFFRELEPRFLALGGRPHWGKLFYANPHRLYEEADWARVEQVRRRLDPHGKFQNDLTRRIFQAP